MGDVAKRQCEPYKHEADRGAASDVYKSRQAHTPRNTRICRTTMLQTIHGLCFNDLGPVKVQELYIHIMYETEIPH